MHVIRKIKSGKNSVKGLIYELEELIFENIRGNYPNNWDDDTITDSLLRRVSTLFHGRKIHVPGDVIKTYCWLYRLGGDSEDKFSDVAILFKISYHDGQEVEGSAFLEVKKKDPNKNTFSAMRKDQLRRIHSSSPHSQLLLLDYDSITDMAFTAVPESIVGYYPISWNNWIPFTYAVTVPSNLAIVLGEKNTSLYKVSVPLSYQLCFRYMYGLDLDYRNLSVETAQGYRTDKGQVRYLMLMSIAHGGADPQQDFDFNRENYMELKE
jgi:hypothetical protein